jgi:Kef-type K+ transport system membrane component KefB/nucleotide-binding universal stress UspA family protein
VIDSHLVGISTELRMDHGASVVVYISQIVVLLIAGRIAGESMQRIGQPPVIGQIIAGIIVGPSVLGTVAPSLYHDLFPNSAEQKAMLDAVAQLGILLLLLMTGMETDLSVFRDVRRPAISVSFAGIVVPFICGVALGMLVPDSILPSPAKRLITALFLGTALSISSVKIVALVVRDLGFLRRTVGQIIIAAAILDDTIGWIMMSVIFGVALHGQVDFPTVGRSVLGTALFLTLSFTIGRRLVFQLIRWSNDSLTSEMATITTILVICGLLALLTNAIGVHLVLGAFIAGVLIGQSPILTKHIHSQLRGLIVALFMPVFFALAGLSADMRALAKPDLLLLTGGLILLASIGKFSGAFLGGRIGGLSYAESFAVGCGMNARGSTEVIVASIGLSMGALTQRLFTAIVTMAVVTTMAMPPMLRWALRRLPMSREEKARLEREEFEAQGFLPHVERLLAAVDASPSGQFASRLVGLLAGVRRIPTTVLHLDDTAARASETTERQAERSTAALKAGVQAGDEAAPIGGDTVDIMSRADTKQDSEAAILAEAKKGYGLLVIGGEPAAQGATLDGQIARSVVGFAGAFAIAVARGSHRLDTAEGPLNILVAVTGTRVSRHGAELAVALAQASRGSLRALHLASASPQAVPWRQRFGRALAPRNSADAIIREIVEIGEHYGIAVKGEIRRDSDAPNAILRTAQSGQHDLLVMGVSPRAGDELSFGAVAAEILERANCSLLFVSSEAAPASGITP